MDSATILSDSLQQALGPTAIIYCLAAIGLNVHFGYTGLLNFGQAGLHGGRRLRHGVARRHLGRLASGSACSSASLLRVVLALLLGVPTLRLRADYLAIVTIAAAEIIRQTVGVGQPARSTFGGQDGLTDFIARLPRRSTRTPSDRHPRRRDWRAYDFWVMTVGWGLVAVCCLIVWLLMRSPWGRVLKSIREDEDAVR